MKQTELFSLTQISDTQWVNTAPRGFKTYDDLLLESKIEAETGLSSDTLTRIEHREIKEIVDSVLSFADSPEGMILKVKRLVDLALESKGQKGIYKIKTLKAHLKRHMFEFVGANTGNYKQDYMVFMKAKQDDVMGKILDALSLQIERLNNQISNA